MNSRSIERAYMFATASIVFGLPLAISYYPVQSDWRLGIEFATLYLLVSIGISIAILLTGNVGDIAGSSKPVINSKRYLLQYLALGLGTFAVLFFSIMRYLLAENYPYPSSLANIFGGLYITFLSFAAAIGIPVVVTRGIGIVGRAMADRSYFRVAIIAGMIYFFTYEILVNEIVITGYNTPPGNYVPSPTGNYPWVYIFTGGPSPANAVESLVYTPYVLIQLNPLFNFFFVPFEILLAIILSTLMGAGIAVVLYSLRRSASIGSACRRGAILSGVGGFIGYTATCPSCLAPTLISAILGGFSVAQQAYTNIYGVLVPPLVSLTTLTLNLLLLNRLNRGESLTLNKPTLEEGSTTGISTQNVQLAHHL